MLAMVRLLAVLLFAGVAAAESTEGYTRLLVPVTAGQVRGANGSLWTTEWTLHNATGSHLYVSGPFPYLSLSPVIMDNELAAGETKRLFLAEAVPGLDGAFIYLPDETVDQVPMSLRVRDISVHAQSYGTSIPIVRPAEFKPSITLIDIPTDPAYRATLRIYSAGLESQTVRVTIYAANRGTPLEQYDVQLHENDSFGIAEPISRPAYVQLDPLSTAARAIGSPIRIEISNLGENVSPPFPSLWAFVSISHNETQQVTTILP
jgi:hypothetical protein